MPLVLDTGPIVAALNRGDRDHDRCAALLRTDEDFAVPVTVLVEVDYWLRKLGGVEVWSNFVSDVTAGAYRVLSLTDDDLSRAAELERAYDDLGLGVVDASVIALCERLGEQRVATLDHRHFAVVRPAHCERLDLLPA